MLLFVGLGVEQSPTVGAVELLKKCKRIFYESYTSPVLEEGSLGRLSTMVSPVKVETLSRESVEEGRKILEIAREDDVALVCSGDPMIATTHQELRTRALRAGIKTKVLHGSSILCAVTGELGLHSYAFGKSVTMTREPMQYTAYLTIFQNLLRGLHTAVLLEWDEKNQFFLSPNAAVGSLMEAEKDIKYGVVTDNTLLLVASEIGTEASRVSSQPFESAPNFDYGKPPHILVIPGRLHFTEKEALVALTGRPSEFFQDNSAGIERVAQKMLSKYSKKTLAALERARAAAKEKGLTDYQSVFENVEAYTSDALRFLNEGKEELAVLSIGYAEGLLDSLRFSGILEFEW